MDNVSVEIWNYGFIGSLLRRFPTEDVGGRGLWTLVSSISELKSADLVVGQGGECTGRMPALVGGLVTTQGSLLPPARAWVPGVWKQRCLLQRSRSPMARADDLCGGCRLSARRFWTVDWTPLGNAPGVDSQEPKRRKTVVRSRGLNRAWKAVQKPCPETVPTANSTPVNELG